MVLVSLITIAFVAQADAPAVHGRALVGVSTFPQYEGARELTVFPFVGGRLQLGQRYLQLDGATLRANVLGTETLELGPVVNYTFGRSSTGSSAIAALGDISGALELGAFLAGSWSPAGVGYLRLALWAVHDVTQVHDGLQSYLTAYYALRLGDRWNVGCEASVSAVTNGYARTYFSVTPTGSRASGLPAYDARGGLKDAGFLGVVSYALNERWWLNGVVSNRWLVGNVARSPIIARDGNAFQLAALLGVSWNF